MSPTPGLPSVDENLFYVRKGTNGFDELKRFIKQGNDLCKDLSAILQERCELEQSYSKSLIKISQKMTKVASSCVGTVANSWVSIADSMKNEAEIRQEFASNLSDEVTKPMRNLNESFHKARKPVESSVDKSIKQLLDKRNEEASSKKKAYQAAKDAEKAWDSLSDLKIQKRCSEGKEKDSTKYEKKCRSNQNCMMKLDRDYYDCCLKAELARVEWEASVIKGSEQLQMLETDRLLQTHEMLKKYQHQLTLLPAALTSLTSRLADNLAKVDVESDISTLVEQRGALLQTSEQILFESYAEDLNNPMDRGRREHALRSYIALIYTDVERELKGKEGLEKLIQVYETTPGFSDDSSRQETEEKLSGVLSMIQFLEASQYKLESTLSALNGTDKPRFRLSHCLERSKCKNGLPQSVLRVPLQGATTPTSSIRGSTIRRQLSTCTTPSSVVHRGQADGRPNFEDEFSDDDPTYAQIDHVDAMRGAAACKTPTRGKGPPPPPPPGNQNRQSVHVCGWARVIYAYAGKQPEELSIKDGEIVSVLEKHPDGWWLGEDSAGTRGIFPGTYVEEF